MLAGKEQTDVSAFGTMACEQAAEFFLALAANKVDVPKHYHWKNVTPFTGSGDGQLYFENDREETFRFNGTKVKIEQIFNCVRCGREDVEDNFYGGLCGVCVNDN